MKKTHFWKIAAIGIALALCCGASFAEGLTYLRITGGDPLTVSPQDYADSRETLTDIDIDADLSAGVAAEVQEAWRAAGFDRVTVWRAQSETAEVTAGNYKYENGLLTAYHGAQTAIRPFDAVYRADGTLQPVTGIADGTLKENATVKRFEAPHSGTFVTVGKEAFAYSALESVDLFDSVREIGDRAFFRCIYLKSLTLPASVVKLGCDVLCDCTALTEVNIYCDASLFPTPAFRSLSALRTLHIDTGNIPDRLFQELHIQTLTLGDGVKRIGERTFAATDVEAAVLPDGATLAKAAFLDCKSLKTVSLACNVSDRCFESCAVEDLTLRAGVQKIGNRAFAACNLPSLTVPDTVEEIGERAFMNNRNLTSVTLPETVRVIGRSAFIGCPVTDADFGCSLSKLDKTDIRELAETLTHLTLHSGTVPEKAFQRSGLESLTLYEGVTRIGMNACMDTKLRTVDIPAGVTLGKGAFSDCTQLTDVTLNSDASENSFARSAVLNLTLGEGCTQIGTGAFRETQLTAVTLPDTVTRLGADAFRGTPLTRLTLSAGLTQIPDGAFADTKLQTVVIPDGVTKVGAAFTGCPIRCFRCGGTLEELSSKTISARDVELFVIGESLSVKLSAALVRSLPADSLRFEPAVSDRQRAAWHKALGREDAPIPDLTAAEAAVFDADGRE